MINNSDFGNKIKELRKMNNLTQKELADKLNVTYQAVSKWERGENYPDLIIIKEISKLFNIDINELMDLEVKRDNKKNTYILMLIFMCLISFVILLCAIIFNSSGEIELKDLSTSCTQFNLSGSIAYNKDKTSIHISSIEYCGLDKDVIYKTINSVLYENDNGNVSEITKIDQKNDLSVEDYLTNLSVHVDSYKKTCKIYTESSIYIELELEDYEGKSTIYKIPLSINDDCN